MISSFIIAALVLVVLLLLLKQRAVSFRLSQTQDYVEQLKKCVSNPAESVSLQFYRETMDDLKQQIKASDERLISVQEELDKVKGSQISKSVRLGQIGEVLAPFLDDFPFDPKQLKPLFQPIDYVHFGEDCITFIEMKTGDSQLTPKQKHIKMLVEQGKVAFQEHRMNEKGYKIK